MLISRVEFWQLLALHTAVTLFELKTSMREAVQSVFDDGISVTQSSGRFTIQDAQGRARRFHRVMVQVISLELMSKITVQIVNLLTNVQNNLSVAWNDDGSALLFIMLLQVDDRYLTMIVLLLVLLRLMSLIQHHLLL